jgi:hypothetical protein
MSSRKKIKVMGIRLTEDDWLIINKIAKKNGTWPGSWVRAVILKELFRLGKRNNDESYIREKVQDC